MVDACGVPGGRPVEPRLDPDVELAALTRALGHPTRVGIVRYLLAQESCVVGDIADQFPLAASTVSQHLKQLKEVGLVRGEIDGPRRCYCVNSDTLDRLKALVGDL